MLLFVNISVRMAKYNFTTLFLGMAETFVKLFVYSFKLRKNIKRPLCSSCITKKKKKKTPTLSSCSISFHTIEIVCFQLKPLFQFVNFGELDQPALVLIIEIWLTTR